MTLGCGAVGDGVTYELREGAGQYDMTVEQLLQKQDKRDRTRDMHGCQMAMANFF